MTMSPVDAIMLDGSPVKSQTKWLPPQFIVGPSTGYGAAHQWDRSIAVLALGTTKVDVVGIRCGRG